MFDITKLALKIPNFLTHKECNGLIDEFEIEEKKNTSIYFENNIDRNTGKRVNSKYKTFSLIPNTSNFKLIKEKTKFAVKIYQNYLNSSGLFSKDLGNTLNFSHKYRILKYEEGTSINPHSDHRDYTYGSISFNLNNSYKGGEFKFFNGRYTVSLDKGDALIFPADYFWIHEVTPITKGIRYSLNSFLLKYPLPVIKKIYELEPKVLDAYGLNTPYEELLGPYN